MFGIWLVGVVCICGMVGWGGLCLWCGRLGWFLFVVWLVGSCLWYG